MTTKTPSPPSDPPLKRSTLLPCKSSSRPFPCLRPPPFLADSPLLGDPIRQQQFQQSTPSPASSVIVFGLPPTLLSPLLEHFSQFGHVLAHVLDPNGGNWVTLTYASELEAARALARNGEVLGGTWMVGVKPLVSVSFGLE